MKLSFLDIFYLVIIGFLVQYFYLADIERGLRRVGNETHFITYIGFIIIIPISAIIFVKVINKLNIKNGFLIVFFSMIISFFIGVFSSNILYTGTRGQLFGAYILYVYGSISLVLGFLYGIYLIL